MYTVHISQTINICKQPLYMVISKFLYQVLKESASRQCEIMIGFCIYESSYLGSLVTNRFTPY